MASIKCDVTDCGYNSDYLCAKNEIHVSGNNANRQEDTSCKSFTTDKSVTSNSTYSTMMTSSMGTMSGNATISCDVMNCTYNENARCDKTSIVVDSLSSSVGTHDQTACASFKAS